MKQVITPQAFTKLLERLGDDRDISGEKYENLRNVLTRFFEWRGAPFPDERTDETLDRVARKLDEGVEIRNLKAYCHEVARLVYLESLRSGDAKRTQLDGEHLDGVEHSARDGSDEKEMWLSCLDECLDKLDTDSRELITEYYRDGESVRIDHRKALAARFGLRRDALANRAQRIRTKLEECVRRCIRQKC